MIMNWRKCTQGLLLASFLSASSPAQAETRSEVINGATCIPYPNQTSVGVAYQYWLYGFGQAAYCHLTMSNEWPVNNLSYVLYTASVSGGVMTVRLCVHSGDLGT